MRRRLKQIALVFLVLLAAAQLIRPNRANPPIEASRTIQAHLAWAPGLSPILDRACGQCHSNATVWPWYTGIAPLSWLMVYGVNLGRKAVNYSEWAAYPPEQQRALLVASCQDASSGKMPGSAYTTLYPASRLSPQDVETICAASREPNHRPPTPVSSNELNHP